MTEQDRETIIIGSLGYIAHRGMAGEIVMKGEQIIEYEEGRIMSEPR